MGLRGNRRGGGRRGQGSKGGGARGGMGERGRRGRKLLEGNGGGISSMQTAMRTIRAVPHGNKKDSFRSAKRQRRPEEDVQDASYKKESEDDDDDDEEGEEDEDEQQGMEDVSVASKKGSSKLPLGFSPTQRILLVGEGDFSFSRALVRLFGGRADALVATSFDTTDLLQKKYGEEGMKAVDELQNSGARVLFGIDATKLQQCLRVGKKKRKAGNVDVVKDGFDRIVFNFPHVGLGIKDESVNVQKNRELLLGFFASAGHVLKGGGEVMVSLKTGKPYSLWNVSSLAHHAHFHLTLSSPFRPAQFPGYAHRRSIGFVEGLSASNNEEIDGKARVYIFKK